MTRTIEELEARLQEAEELLNAIRRGEVDALVPWKRISWQKDRQCDLKGHGKDRTPHGSVGGHG